MERNKHIIPSVVNDVGTSNAYNEKNQENLQLLSNISALLQNYELITGNLVGLTDVIQRLDQGELSPTGRINIEEVTPILSTMPDEEIIGDIIRVHMNLLVTYKQRPGVKVINRENKKQH